MYKPTLSISRLVRFQGQSFLKQTTRGFADAPKRSKDKVTKQKDGSYKIEFVTNPFTLHKLQTQPSTTSITTRDEMLNYFRQMSVMRRMEVAADNLYKQKLIRGFLHLYNGQEAIVVGTEASITKDDHVITAYRDHAHHVGRGGTVKEVMAELMGKKAGMSAGKGGSMHMYKADANYHGGNGIVGAQVPIGAGIAFAMKYRGRPNICLASYGDGAANQGQVFEAYNMAALWKVPCLFVCENNKYGMGTSAERAAADTNYFKKGDYVPGLKIDAMNVYAVKEGIKYAKDYALKNGPLVIEMETYRYMGHSMSDPGVGYRSRDEINKAREERDPIDRVRFLMLENNIAKEEELTAIENEIRKEVDDAVEFAKNAPYPEPIELYTDVYSKNSKPYFIRTVELPNSLTIN